MSTAHCSSLGSGFLVLCPHGGKPNPLSPPSRLTLECQSTSLEQTVVRLEPKVLSILSDDPAVIVFCVCLSFLCSPFLFFVCFGYFLLALNGYVYENMSTDGYKIPNMVGLSVSNGFNFLPLAVVLFASFLCASSEIFSKNKK